MEDVIQILNKTQFGFLATIENGKPRVRPFQFQFEDGAKLYFCSSEEKNVIRQLRDFPYAEYSAFDKSLQYVRIRGKINFSDDIELKNKVLKVNPWFKEKYLSATSSDFVLFYINHGTAELGSYDKYPPEAIKF